MEKRLLSVSQNIDCLINIGDYIQALAASQFVDKIDGFVEREELREYSEKECKVIMNGWYMHNPKEWPPSSLIHPLFISFHINSTVWDRFSKDDSLAYLKRYEPIGCRDYDTMRFLNEYGIDAYFSGCLTLTLGKKYKATERNDAIYFVDPYFRIRDRSFTWKFVSLLYLSTHFISVLKLKKKRNKEVPFSIGNLLDNAWFLKLYSGIFKKDVVLKAEYIQHESVVYNKQMKSNEERLAYAEYLVEKYARASLVVTSRIHCALPCIGLDTPIIYIEDLKQPQNSKCRLGGLLELFNIIKFDQYKLKPQFEFKEKIDIDKLPKSKEKPTRLIENLCNNCTKFMQ